MNISKITCSDLQEHNHIDKVLELLSFSPLVELGIQTHDDAMNRAAAYVRAALNWRDAHCRGER